MVTGQHHSESSNVSFPKPVYFPNLTISVMLCHNSPRPYSLEQQNHFFLISLFPLLGIATHPSSSFHYFFSFHSSSCINMLTLFSAPQSRSRNNGTQSLTSFLYGLKIIVPNIHLANKNGYFCCSLDKYMC